MHGVISHLRTRLPTKKELALYREEGQFRSVQLSTDDATWEQYFKEFAQREDAARLARSISAIQSTSPRPKPSLRHASEEEEEQEATSDERWRKTMRKGRMCPMMTMLFIFLGVPGI
jgi:hypothetical protein